LSLLQDGDMVRSLSIIGLAAGASLLLAAPSAGQTFADFTIEPGKRAGPITQDTTEAQLRRMLPKGQVKRVFKHVHVGYYRCGTEVFSGTENAAFIAWGSMDRSYEKETKAHVRECLTWPSASQPQSIIVETKADMPDAPSAWHTSSGIRLGMGIRHLEAVTGEPFEILLCPCEFAGVLMNQPTSYAFRKIELRISFPEGAHKTLKEVVRPDDEYAVYAADVPNQMAHDFIVSTMSVSLEKDYEEE
jgi:hypothetical protein